MGERWISELEERRRKLILVRNSHTTQVEYIQNQIDKLDAELEEEDLLQGLTLDWET